MLFRSHCSKADLAEVGQRLLRELPSMTRQLALRMTNKRKDCRSTLMALALGAAPTNEATTQQRLFTFDPRCEFVTQEQESDNV